MSGSSGGGHSRSSEAFWWSLFSGGGVMSALFVPVLILGTGFVLPFMAGDDASASYERVHGVLSMRIVQLAVFGVLFLSFFHCAHRLRHVLIDVGLRGISGLLSVVCYGGALAGTVIAAIVVFGIS